MTHSSRGYRQLVHRLLGPIREPAMDPLFNTTPSAFSSSYGAAPARNESDPVSSYFECITACSVDDGECVTQCVEVLREQQ